MIGVFSGYLAKRALLERWPLLAGDTGGVEQAVVIPAFAEYPRLFQTLDDLAAHPEEELRRTLVICVINHRTGVAREDIENNQCTLAALEGYARARALRLAWVDAATPGNELPEKDGVGLARKIGLDAGLAVLARNEQPEGPLLCLDADTRVDTTYLTAVRDFYRRGKRWAAIVEYAHPLDTPERAAILCYELFLRYHELGLRYAGSPYAFPSIGSTMTCTARAYAAAGGMNRRQAGEDFYFLQQLAKTGVVERIHAAAVRPSPRASHRVPFGTGKRVIRFLEQGEDEYVLYHPESYRILKAWLAVVRDHLHGAPQAMLDRAREISPELERYLVRQNFSEAFSRLQANHRDPERLWRQFHCWFDAFRTLKLMHHLRDYGHPQQEMFGAIFTLLQWMEPHVPVSEASKEDLAAQEKLLLRLRKLTAQTNGGHHPLS